MPLTDDRLGTHLVKSGLLGETQLTRVLMEQTGPDGSQGRKPLGQRLVEKGFTSETVIRQAMCRLTLARLFEVAHWRRGVFTYDEPAQMPEFRIAIRGDIQELLLRTQVRIDQGERPRKTIAVEQEGPCQGCPVTDCTPAIKTKYLRQDVCLWKKMSSVPDVRKAPLSVSDALSGGRRLQSVNPLYSLEDPLGEPSLQGGWVAF